MKYVAAQVDNLAAEYVLGTLHGPARRRFDRLIRDRADVRFAVWRWERRLNAFAEALEPRKPRRHVWRNIHRRTTLARPAKTRFFDWGRGLWLALPTAAAAAWLAVALVPTGAPERMAVFADQSAETLWVISADLDQGLLQTQAVNPPASGSNTVYELWILAADGPPLSLGLLPVDAGSVESQISTQLIDALTNAGRLAISLEPVGGSPTGLPTGPVVYQASLLTI